MGLTFIKARVSKPKGKNSKTMVRFLVDSGAIYSVLPYNVATRLKITPLRKVEFTLADGSTIVRSIGEATFELHGYKATSPVVIGEKNDTAILGTVTLETLGLMLNPLTRELKPIKMILA